jgi:putative membrane protein
METEMVDGDPNTRLAARRTEMAFQRTRMAEDRTLMAVIRTSLSLIGFGFTIFNFFNRLRETNALSSGSQAPARLGLVLVYLGVGMLGLGILYHVQFMVALRRTRKEMVADGQIDAICPFPVSLTLITATLLLLIGLVTIVSMMYNIGPFE